MNLLLVGVNHKTASVELREKLACLTPDLDQAYRSLKDYPELAEIILYSTCNRVELLCAAPAQESDTIQKAETQG